MKRGAIGCLIALAALAACTPPTPEAQISKFLSETVARAEKRDVEGVAERLAEDYTDLEGRDKADTIALVKEYFGRYRGIVIHLLGVRVEHVDPGGEAEARAELMLSSGAAEVLRRLMRYGETYKFDLRLARAPGGGWQLKSAAWEQVDSSGLLPESLRALEKIFSGH
jgi:hypothetical protein